MLINRYISFLFMLITVLSAHPEDTYDLKGISNLDFYNNIIKSGIELSQNQQYFKNSGSIISLAGFVQSSNEHQRFIAAVNNGFSMNNRLFAVYNMRLEHKNVISLERNDVWRHAVF